MEIFSHALNSKKNSRRKKLFHRLKFMVMDSFAIFYYVPCNNNEKHFINMGKRIKICVLILYVQCYVVYMLHYSILCET